jgi:hypothetical protein
MMDELPQEDYRKQPGQSGWLMWGWVVLGLLLGLVLVAAFLA